MAKQTVTRTTTTTTRTVRFGGGRSIRGPRRCPTCGQIIGGGKRGGAR